MGLQRFHGGLDLPAHKEESTRAGIRACAMPAQLCVSMLQHAGLAALPCVAPGDQVRAGQRIGVADGDTSADVHAPSAGTVHAVAMIGSAMVPGLATMHVTIDTRPGAETPRLPALDWAGSEPAALRERIRAAGVVGLGGAGFPTARKLAVGRDLLVLNGAECEPWIACDDALLREQAGEVVQGGQVLARAAGAARVLLAIEDSMVEALAAARAAAKVHGDTVEVVAVPTRYPQGGERQLIQALTGREVPRGGLPRDIGVLVQNVATAQAAWRAVAHGEPLTERIVTVTGPGVADPGNFRVPLGTSVAHLVEQAGGYTAQAARLLLGGPMMGQALAHDGFPVGKTHHCVLVLDHAQVHDPVPELPCIRCGDCAGVCPSRLLPQQLLWQVRGERMDLVVDQGLFDCIECGACDLACPSHIPLTRHFREAKAGLRQRDLDAARALAARDRFKARAIRHERESRQRAERDAARQAGATSPDAVAAALERARARRAAQDQDPPA